MPVISFYFEAQMPGSHCPSSQKAAQWNQNYFRITVDLNGLDSMPYEQIRKYSRSREQLYDLHCSGGAREDKLSNLECRQPLLEFRIRAQNVAGKILRQLPQEILQIDFRTTKRCTQIHNENPATGGSSFH